MHFSITKGHNLHIILFIFLILSIAITSVLSMIRLQDVIESETENYAQTTENNLYTLLNNELNNSIMITNEMANSTFLYNWITKYDRGLADGDEIVQFLKNKVDSTIAENAVFVSAATLDDYTDLGFNKTLSRKNSHDVWFYNFIASGKPYVLNIDTEETRDLQKMLFVNRRIEDTDKKLLGVCCIGIPFDVIDNILQTFNQKENVTTFLVDANGNIQFGKNNSSLSKINLKKIIQEADSTEAVTTKKNEFNGFTSVQYLKEFDWYMIMFSENNSINIEFSNFIKNAFFIFALILVIYISCMLAFFWQWEKKKLAEYANESKTAFLSRMSHDLRTPMNGILGMVHIAKENIEDPDRVLDALGKIETSSHQLQALLNDVLEMSHIETKKTELCHKEFNLRELLHELSPSTEVLAEQYGVQRTGSHYDITHEWVIGSPVHLQRVLQNLLTNALKYNRPGGTLEVWCKEEALSPTKSNFIFTIKDTGIGMSPEFQKHMFEPFSREQTTMASTRNGTGLGMAITKEFVDLSGGTITVDSEQNVGTCITVTIPMDVIEDQKIPNRSSKEFSLEGLHILLGEDNPLNAEIATYILQERGAIITLATNGKDAVDQFKQSSIGNFDLILMDIMMPEMNGYEATTALRQLSRSDAKTIPIIAMTANALSEDIKKCLAVGMNDHIQKPLNITNLLEKISDCLL